jgi:hydrogenase maturation protein HypF
VRIDTEQRIDHGTYDGMQRVRLAIYGLVQGVGFRPFVYRLAEELELSGWVRNSSGGVVIEVEGSGEKVSCFVERISRDAPANSAIHRLERATLTPSASTGFHILASDDTGVTTASILPDVATCPECLRDLTDPSDRRYGYPFTNCTHCGPRFTIVESLPYDRPNTSMSAFVQCESCLAEYDDPLDRRFHAQANACPECGPWLRLTDGSGTELATHEDALGKTADAIREGAIVAIKGLGGFHLVVSARDEGAVQSLRERKRREEKPMAVMVPSCDRAREYCSISALEERILRSPQAPIVLLPRRNGRSLAPSIAPSNPYLGVMLPYTPLHHLLMRDLDVAVVATSGNVSDEPICIDGSEARDRLRGIADLFLDHNRPILRPVDDSVVCIIAGRPCVLRRARGYAPAPLAIDRPHGGSRHTLAVGGHLKNTFAITVDSNALLSQHVGDLSSAAAFLSYKRNVSEFTRLYNLRLERVVCDSHPDYLSTAYAKSIGVPTITVQHHHAHVLACMAEHKLRGPLLGVCWDGTGFGLDGTVWGGEFLRIDAGGHFSRAAHLRHFSLPGGELAVKEPRRAAMGILHEIFGAAGIAREELHATRTFSSDKREVIVKMLQRDINSPRTSSAGRLFDAVSSLLDLHQRSSYEGQAAMALEFAARGRRTRRRYPWGLIDGAPLVLDWEPMIRAILDDAVSGTSCAAIAASFHATLAEMIVRACECVGLEVVVLTGGCFQNRLLTELAIAELRRAGFRPHWHEQIPPNDGGLAFGQIAAATRVDDGGETH